MTAIYNEIEAYPAEWMRNLIAAGHIAPGVVDERSVVELQPEDVRGATQAHFFAGIGVWSHALRLAGWTDDRPVWTGSCPCQPFSTAGRGRGFDDDRHLWPEWFRLINECRPPVIFGEQVASPAGLGWFDVVRADLEGAGYSVGVADLCAASVGAPHIRQRLYFVAVADVQQRYVHAAKRQPGRGVLDSAGRGAAGELANLRGPGLEVECEQSSRRELAPAERSCEARVLADVPQVGRRQGDKERSRRGGRAVAHEERDRSADDREAGELGNAELHDGSGRIAQPHGRSEIESDRSGVTRGFWSDAEWISCRDGKARPVEPGTFPLAHRAPARVGRLRAYGNSIVPQVAAAFIASVMEAIQ